MRGIPGSGKSTKANRLADPDGIICSADDFFMVNGEYKFDRNRISAAHNQCWNKFCVAVKNGVEIVIVDNTNTRNREFKRYVKFAEKYGYNVDTVLIEEFDVVKCFKRNTHAVPFETIQRMADQLQESVTGP